MAFGVDLAVRVALTNEPKLRYLRRYWYDVAIVVLSVAPLERPLRTFRAVRLLRGVRVWPALHKAIGVAGRMWSEVHGKGLLAGCATLAVVSLGVVFVTESSADGSSDSVGSVLWWAIVTVTTVGYGGGEPHERLFGRAVAAPWPAIRPDGLCERGPGHGSRMTSIHSDRIRGAKQFLEAARLAGGSRLGIAATVTPPEAVTMS